MPRILISPRDVEAASIRIRDQATLHHFVRVLRARPGETFECSDGAGRWYKARVARCAEDELLLDILERADEPRGGLSVHLLPALVRAERFDWLVQKATELGVDRITPVLTERAVVRLSAEQAPGKLERWRRIARESAQQCGSSTLPRIDPPASFETALAAVADHPFVLLPTLAMDGEPLRQALGRRPGLSSAAVLIGPEGDFTPEEAARAVRQGAVPVSLGRRVLRSETAAIAVLAVLRHAAGEL